MRLFLNQQPANSKLCAIVALFGFLSISEPISNAGPAPSYQWGLDDVVKIALEHNPDLKSAKANYEAVSKTVGEAWSGYLPHIDLSASFQESTLPVPSAGSTQNLGIFLPYTKAVASLNQTIFDFGKTLDQIEASSAQSHSAEQNAIAVRNIIQLSVERAFYAVTAAQKLVEVAQKGVARSEETHRRAEVMVKAGVRPAFDLSQANVDLAKSKLSLINARNSLDLSKVALLNIMGMDKHVEFVLKEVETTSTVESAKLNLDHLTEKALGARPEVRKSAFDVEAARDLMHGEIRNYFPTLYFAGWYGKFLPDYPVELRDAWSVGVGLSWNIMDGLMTSFKVGELAARVDQSQALEEKEREHVIADVTSGFMNLVRSEQNLTVANEGYEASKENLRLAKRRYDANVGTILELLVAEASMVSGEAQAIVAKYDHTVAIQALQIAVNAPLLDAESGKKK